MRPAPADVVWSPVTSCERRSRRLTRGTLVNGRDLGGLRVIGGAMTQLNVAIRCGNLALLDDTDAAWLGCKVGLRLALDLRTEREIGADGAPAALIARGVRWQRTVLSTSGPYLGGEPLPGWRAYAASYRELTLGLRGPLSAALDVVAAGYDCPVAFFCTAGKDRTGVLAATILWSLRVTDRDIIRDYALTARELRPRLDAFASHWEAKGLTRTQYSRRLEACPQAMAAHLGWLRRRFGTPAVLLRELGIPPAILGPVRERLVTSRSMAGTGS